MLGKDKASARQHTRWTGRTWSNSRCKFQSIDILRSVMGEKLSHLWQRCIERFVADIRAIGAHRSSDRLATFWVPPNFLKIHVLHERSSKGALLGHKTRQLPSKMTAEAQVLKSVASKSILS